MSLDLTFFGWWRPRSASSVSGPTLTNGRLQGEITLTAQDLDVAADSAARTLPYDLVGPGDVQGLLPAAVVRTSPARGAMNADFDKAVYAELAAPDIPWRYTVALPSGRVLAPWLALLVGTTDEIRLQGDRAQIDPAVLDAHPRARGAVGAHVEKDAANPASPPVARIISSRALQPDRDHRAVIVPAFDANGQPAWQTPAAGPVELPAYHEWTFRTRAGGDFASLARRLRPQRADADLGIASVRYAPVADGETVALGGALVSATRAPGDPGAPGAGITSDLAQLTVVQGDAAHPVLGLPAYDEPWPDAAPGAATPPAPPTGWRGALRDDPRPRAVAGLGTRAGVHHQDMLAAAASRLAGAYEQAAERLRRLSLGLLASRSLWRRRMPTDGARRLTVLGPALRNVLSATGPVAEVLEQPDRALGPALFSSAAKRAWRMGAAAEERHDTYLRRAAVPPPPLARDATAAPHVDDLARTIGRPALDDIVGRDAPPLRTLSADALGLGRALDRTGIDPATLHTLDTRLAAVHARLESGQGTSLLALLRLADPLTRTRPTREQLHGQVAALDAAPDSDDLAALGRRLTRRPPTAVSRPVDLDAAAGSIAGAFDPTLERPSLVDRVTGGIDGLDAHPLAPQELKPDLPMAAWRFLRDEAPEWLLPGAGQLPDDSVLALTTNAAFVDAFLLGLNAQILGELRFRNLPVLPGWTPVRTFWERAQPAAATTDDDIVGIDQWPAAAAFGDPALQTPAAASPDLVVLFNTPLFRDYPGTLVYLVTAPLKPDGSPDWIPEPDFATALFPSFQGQLAAERVFFGFDLDPALVAGRWVVLEETVRGRRFWNAANPTKSAAIAAAPDGADLARVSVSPPRRVLIRGDVLMPRTTP